MPWCDSCDRFLSPNTVHDDGTCPSCGGKIASPTSIRRTRRGKGSSADAMAVRADRDGSERTDAAGRTRKSATKDGEAESKTPWHFKVLVVALVFYLGFRLIQLLVIVGHWL